MLIGAMVRAVSVEMRGRRGESKVGRSGAGGGHRPGQEMEDVSLAVHTPEKTEMGRRTDRFVVVVV